MNHGAHREHGETLFPELSASIVTAAIEVHKTLGPGLLESVYETCLCYELEQQGLNVKKQVHLPIKYQSLDIDSGLRLDLLIENSIIIELKAVEKLLPIHQAQLITYLKLADKRLGFLFNFNVKLMREGIKRIVR